jgi:hypothetical protein
MRQKVYKKKLGGILNAVWIRNKLYRDAKTLADASFY